MKRLSIPFEQAVYGSFPFWDRGYAVLAHSPRCRAEWLAELKAACQRYGERPSGAAEAGGLLAQRLASGPWMIVRPSEQGCDDQGRPGALAFHALFVSPADYRKAGCDPFAFIAALKADWTAETRSLRSGVCEIEPEEGGPDDPRAASIVDALAGGRHVALEADGPIDALARQVWRALPGHVRERASVATWAFRNAPEFDLIALPRIVSEGPVLSPSSSPAARIAFPSTRTAIFLALAVIVTAVSFGLTLRHSRGRTGPAPVVASPPTTPPDRSHYRDESSDPDERRRVSEALTEAAERFGLTVPDDRADPSALMALWARELRYDGPRLSADERGRLSHTAGRDAALALRWDEHVRRFLADRPLPEGFARGPLRWQLDTLIWSYHLDGAATAPGRSAPEVVHALADGLAVDLPVHASPLARDYPALAGYTAFLGRLPRR